MSDLHACVRFHGSKKVEKHWSTGILGTAHQLNNDAIVNFPQHVAYKLLKCEITLTGYRAQKQTSQKTNQPRTRVQTSHGVKQSEGKMGKKLQWVIAFLSDRWQKVFAAKVGSMWSLVLSNVPHRSILRTVLFVCYANNMPKLLKSIC